MSEVVGQDAIASSGDGITYLAHRQALQSVFSFLTDKDRLELALTSKIHWKEVEKCSKSVLKVIRKVHRADADWKARVRERLGMGGGNDQAASYMSQLWASKRVYLRIVANDNAEEENSDDGYLQDDDGNDGETLQAGLPRNNFCVTALAVSPSSNFIAIGTSQGTVEVWNCLSKTCRRFTHSPSGNKVHGVLMVNDSLVVSCSLKRICVWSATNEGHWSKVFLYQPTQHDIVSWTFNGTVVLFAEGMYRSSYAVKSLQLQQGFNIDTKFSSLHVKWIPILFQSQSSIFLFWKNPAPDVLPTGEVILPTGELLPPGEVPPPASIDGFVIDDSSGQVETLETSVADVSSECRQAKYRIRVADSFYFSNGFDPEEREGTFSIIQEGSAPDDIPSWRLRVPFRAGVADESDDQVTPKRFLSFPYGAMGESVVSSMAHPAAATEASEVEAESSSRPKKNAHGNEIYVAGGDHFVVVAYLLEEPRL